MKHDASDYVCGGLPEDCSAVAQDDDWIDPTEIDTAGNKGSWLEDCKSMVKHNGNITYVEKGAIKIPFVTVDHMTQEGNNEAGAILFTLLDLTTGEVVEKWIPKTLCSNLHPEGYYIYVWSVFAQQHLTAFYKEPDDDDDD